VPQLPSDILRQRKQHARRDDFSRRAKDVVNDLAKLTDFLNRHYKDYVDVLQSSALTDAERDKIDAAAQHIIKTCAQQANALKKCLDDGGGGGQVDDHRKQIVRYVEWRLKCVSRLFAEIRGQRSQRYAVYENVSKLSNLTHGLDDRPKESPSSVTAAAAAAATVDYEATKRQYDAWAEDELSPEELQMFEAENIEMFNELNQMSNEVRTHAVCLVCVLNFCLTNHIVGKKYRVQGGAHCRAARAVHREDIGTRPGSREDRHDCGEHDRKHSGRQHGNKVGHSKQRRSQGVHIVFHIGTLIYLTVFGLV